MDKVCKALSFFIITIFIFISSIAYAGNTQRVSISSKGEQADYSSYNPSISADGRFVAFDSDTDNLVSNDTNKYTDVYVYDRQTSETKRVSLSSAGVQGNHHSFNPSISADGKYVAFRSWASNLVYGDTNGKGDIFIYEMKTGITQRVSISGNGSQTNADSTDPSISADGRYVVFQSYANNLVTGDINERQDVFVRDMLTGRIQCVSMSADGKQGNANSGSLTGKGVSISADGTVVAFSSWANNLVNDDTNGCVDIFVHNIMTNNTQRISVSSNGTQANSTCSAPVISADGKFVVYESLATNLVIDDTNSSRDIFIYEIKTGKTERASLSSSLVQGNDNSWEPSINTNGKFVAFSSNADNLVSGDTNGSSDVFIHDMQTGNTQLASISRSGKPANDNTYSPSINSDGKFVAFESDADNLVMNDVNGATDIFVHEMDVLVTGVSLNKTILSLNKGASETLVPTISPDDATNKDVIWTSSKISVATVDNSGKVDAIGKGTCTITVTTVDGSKTATCQVTVNNPVTGVTLNKPTLSINKGATETLVATVSPIDAVNKSVTWSTSDATIATVDTKGLVTAVSEGNCIITVTTVEGGKTATCQVTVKIPVTEITLNKTTLSLNKGATETLKATVSPTNATNKEITWSSSNDTIASVDNNGLVTAKSGGTCNIIATSVDSLKTGTCQVTVIAPVSGITLNKTSLLLNRNATETLIATILPNDATNKTVAWSSSNDEVATVDSNSLVTGVGEGNCIITATTVDGGKTATCEVTVKIPVTEITLNKTSLSLNKNVSETLVATIFPDDATNKDVTWSSSNAAIASVDNNGLVTSRSGGYCNIIATSVDSLIAATCKVTVISPISGITLNKTILPLDKGATESLIATISPTDATNKAVTWSSNNNAVATVDSNGKVMAIGSGACLIKVTTIEGGITASCQVNVNVPVTGVTLNKTTLSLDRGSSETLVATVTPADAINTAVIWSSNDNDVATVDDNGTVTAVGYGTCAIRVKTDDGAKTSSCIVRVQSMIYFTNPTTAESCNSFSKSINIGGRIDSSIINVKWQIDNKRKGSCKLSGGTWNASKIGLVLGDNTITVTATTKTKQIYHAKLLVHYIDNTEPEVKISSPSSSFTYKTTKAAVNISGSVKDIESITEVSWVNTTTGASGVCTGTKSWKALAIALNLGNNKIIVSATDTSGNVGSEEIIVTRVDKIKPKIAITSPTGKSSITYNELRITLGGTASDDFGLSKIEWFNKSTGAFSVCAGTTEWYCTIPLKVGKNSIIITAIDTSYNKATDTITVTRKY